MKKAVSLKLDKTMIQQIINLSGTILGKMPERSKARQQFLIRLFSCWLLIQGRHNIRNISRYLGCHEVTISRWMGFPLIFRLIMTIR